MCTNWMRKIDTMKNLKPSFLVLFAALLIFTCYLLSFGMISWIIYNHLDWLVFLVSGLIVFLVSYLTFRFILKNFIYDRIKLVYKTIHTRKLTKDEKSRKVNLNEDIIHQVNQQVQEWADKRTDEIERLRSLEAYRREFLGNISHELKTPIANIQGYILTLLDGALDDAQVNREYLEKSQRNVERMIHIIEDLDLISQLETGSLVLNPSEFDIVSLTRDIYELLEDKALQKQINLIFHEGIDPDTEISVNADKERIKQVLINLVDNSVKYGKEGGRTKVSFYDMDENILVEVSDNGIGIPAEHLPRLFERFYRVDKSRSRNMGGSGLGLAIVKHILESHQQTVNVRSTPGVGSTFSFTLLKGNR